MFRLHTSNDAARLADALGDRLGAAMDDPLVPARVLVPQAGLARWLQIHLAARLGVLANVEFTPPAQFTWELLRAARPELPAHSPFDVEYLRWHLYALLGEALDGDALAPLRQYLDAPGDLLRRYALSFQLARAYERMQGYRRQKLIAWTHGAGAVDWQAELWRRVLPRVGGAARAARVDAWLRAYDPDPPGAARADPIAPPGLPQHLACFACANVSPDVLRMLAVAGRHCDVDFYLPLPSMEYLGDVPRTRADVRARLAEHGGENPLILALGGALTEFVELLFGYQYVQPDVEHDPYDARIAGDSLLARVRNDILLDRAPAPDAPRPARPDPSMQFHACHTELREIETLQDALLTLLDADATLQPRDIAVLMPDVARYQPAIDAVFGAVARDDPRYLPWSLGDAGAARLHPVVALLLKLLDAPTSRWDVDELTDVIAAPGVQRRLDLDADAAARLVRRLRDAGVRWGEDERARADQGGYREFSWAFGVERIVAGFAAGDPGAELVGATAPLAGVEGAAFAELDAILAVTATWRHLRELARQPHRPRDWQQALNAALDALYQPDPQDATETRALEHVRAALARLVEHAAAAGPDATLPWPDLRAYLREQLASPAPQQWLFTGGVTFCGMVPLRVVPFRVICLIGMDEAAFPRREAGELDPLLADRRAGKPERGDRDVRADDRLLFLQLLAAARDTFYVSWIGRDARTNAALQPSAVVTELMDCLRANYLDATGGDAGAAELPRVEPLHPFDPTLFAERSADARAYQRQWLPAASTSAHGTAALPRFAVGALPLPTAAPAALALDDLKRFFADPARGFLERGLGLRLPYAAGTDPDLEPLSPNDPLLRYALSRAVLERGADDAAAGLARLRAEGRLPPGDLGTEALAIARARAAQLTAAFNELTGGGAPLPELAGTLDLPDGARVTGSVGGRYATGLVRAKVGHLEGKFVLRAFLDQLFAIALGGAPVPCLLCWIGDNNRIEQRALPASEPDAARARLRELLGLMEAGSREPLPLLPRESWAALTKGRGGARDAATFAANLADAFAAAADGFGTPGSDFNAPAVRMAWRGLDFSQLDAVDAARFHATATMAFPELAAIPTRP
jgi:exodeoxyribonuclease V gamma subunit